MLTPTMPALRWHAAGDVRLDQVPAPNGAPPGMALVAISCCGICGTDLAEWRDGPFMIRGDAHPLTGQRPPITLGHELSGRVIAVGEGVGIEPGTRVTADACWRCNACPACASGDYHRCRLGGSIGLHSDGGFAPLALLPAYCLVPLPDAVGDEAAALSEPLAVALHALDRAALRAAEDLLILGFGPIGAAAALAGRTLGARVLVVDNASARSAAAGRLGFETLEAGDGLARRLRTRLGRLGADVVAECTGIPQLLSVAVDCADRGGRVALVGLAKVSAEIDPSRLTLFERTLVGSLGYRHDLPRVVRLMASGALDPRPLISETIALDAAVPMFARLTMDPGERIKVLVRPGEPPAPVPSR